MKNISKRILALLMSLVIVAGLAMTASASDVVYGDINKDTKINSIDALMILRHSVQIDVLPEDMTVIADVNGDGRINSVDALEILMVSVGNLPYFSAEVTVKAPKNDNEILAIYNNAIVDAREAIPAYKFDLSSTATKVDLSGSLVDDLPEEELNDLKKDLLQEDKYSNIMRQGTSAALKNLPLLSGITDASVFKSVSYERLPTGEYSVRLEFKDEKNPKTDSLVSKFFGLPDYATMKQELESGSTPVINMKVGDMYYKNGYISFVLDPRTGEFVSVDMSVDMAFTAKITFAIVYTLNMDAVMCHQMQYSNFIY